MITHDEQKLLQYFNQYEKVIIFGAGLVSTALLKWLADEKLLNKIFCIAVSSKSGNPAEILGVPVCETDDLCQYNQTCLVIIATLEKQHKEIELHLQNHGFLNIDAIGNVCYANLRQKNPQYDIDILNELRLTNRIVPQMVFTKLGEMDRRFSEMLYEITRQNEICATHTEVFGEYRNCNIGKDIVVLGSGPTINHYSPIAGAIHIGVNHAFLLNHIKLDYYFCQDCNVKTKRDSRYIENIISLKECKKFFGRFRNDCSYKSIEFSEMTRIKADGNLFFVNTALEEDVYPDIRFHPLMDFASVIFPAIHFALFTNPKRLYLAGCDVSKNGHFFDENNQPPDDNIIGWIEGYRRVKEFAEIYYPDTEIISINPVGLKGKFKDVYTKTYIEENKMEYELQEIDILDKID